jgi:hypothetical protein
MSQDYGGESPRGHTQTVHRTPTRYLVVIEAGGVAVARLFLANREAVAEFDAGTEEAAQLTAGRVAAHGAEGPEWDQALAGHSADERRAAAIYTLDA